MNIFSGIFVDELYSQPLFPSSQEKRMYTCIILVISSNGATVASLFRDDLYPFNCEFKLHKIPILNLFTWSKKLDC